MAINRIYVVVPKEESVGALTLEESMYASSVLNEFVGKCLDYGKEVFAFSENLSVFNLLEDIDRVKLQSTVGAADKYFILNNVKGLPEGYRERESLPADKNWLKSAANKYKSNNVEGIDPFAQLSKRLNIAVNRSRLIAGKYLEDNVSVIIHLKSGNSFCSVPEPYIGDGKLIITIHPRIRSYEVRYGGALLERNSEIIDVILKGVI